jgi:hypothetical protein
MSIDLGLLPLTPQTGHCVRAASQAFPKELLGKGLACRWEKAMMGVPRPVTLPPFRKFISAFAPDRALLLPGAQAGPDA